MNGMYDNATIGMASAWGAVRWRILRMDIILPKIWTEMPKDYSGDFVFALNRSLGRVYDVLSESATIFSHMKELTYEVGILAIQVYRILACERNKKHFGKRDTK